MRRLRMTIFTLPFRFKTSHFRLHVPRIALMHIASARGVSARGTRVYARTGRRVRTQVCDVRVGAIILRGTSEREVARGKDRGEKRRGGVIRDDSRIRSFARKGNNGQD
jgi:hypothetical protein